MIRDYILPLENGSLMAVDIAHPKSNDFTWIILYELDSSGIYIIRDERQIKSTGLSYLQVTAEIERIKEEFLKSEI